MASTICVLRDTRRLKNTLVILSLFLCLVAEPARSQTVEAHPGSSAEALYAEAVLAFNRKQSREAARILNELLKESPEHLPALELMALSLKEEKDDIKAVEVYERLLKLKPDQAGPYHFELGVIRHRQKQGPQATQHFRKALQARFNESASHLFLGLISFDSGNLTLAERHFAEVKRKGNPELKVVGHYYAGMIHFKNGYGAGGTAEMNEARSLARSLPDSKMAADIAVAADKILAPFNMAQWFSSLSLLGQYDSNISLIPSGAASAQVSSKATPNLILSGGGGRMSSPVGAFQWVGSYRFAINKTMSGDTREYDFFTQTPSIYLTYNPLGPTSVGLKADGSISFQNRSESPGDPAATYQYRPYSLGVEAGPFLRHTLNERWAIQAEATARPQKNFSDANLTGSSLIGRFSLKGTTKSPLFSPGLSAVFEKNRTRGANERYQSVGGGVSNHFRFGASDTLNVSADALLSKYPDSATLRSDKNLVGRLSYIHRFSDKWSLLGDLTYIKNVSTNAETHSYNRMTAGLGMGWAL